MFCKNLIVYEFDNGSFLSQINNDLLRKIAYTPCSPIDAIKNGFISPLDNGDVMKLSAELVKVDEND
ncbi:hypothetical protein DES39_0515 [Orbus hercynius]|uniref:Uncharacterized protein n=1 Tax=Orbus hercynius TaxID=593135 RepID=A0A495RIQ2_9GAMM|nr:hypothetical protein [Orbus hercynius]RKS87295.1 hypothetical protein DES39_0515 [Orbus hercynius]